MYRLKLILMSVDWNDDQNNANITLLPTLKKIVCLILQIENMRKSVKVP